MAIQADGGGSRTSNLNGKDNAKPSFSSKLKKLAVAVPGIVGSSIVEGIGGPKARGAKAAVVGAEKIAPAVVKFAERTGARILADRKGAQIVAEKAARITPKTSDKVARAAGREAAGPKAKGPGGKPQITRNNKSLKDYDTAEKTAVAVRTGTKPGEFKNVERINQTGGASPERAATATEKTARSKEVTVKRMTAAEKTAAKNASDPQGYKAATARREAAKPTTAGVKKYTPSNNKLVRRARSVDQLGKSSDARLAEKTTAKEQAKATARANRAKRPALTARATKQSKDAQTSVALKGPGKLKSGTLGGKLRESTANATVPKKEIESRSLKVATRNASKAENVERGRTQPTIESRMTRPKEPTDREIEILRTVGKRDYSRGEVNPLAQKTVQNEADSIVNKTLKDPRVKAQDAARERAAVEKFKSDKTIERSVKGAPKKTFRGKPRTRLIKKGK